MHVVNENGPQKRCVCDETLEGPVRSGERRAKSRPGCGLWAEKQRKGHTSRAMKIQTRRDGRDFGGVGGGACVVSWSSVSRCSCYLLPPNAYQSNPSNPTPL
ncbi:uncharacterized protein SPSK_10069 [Sporothrix schenckii 1099-18]|uniref:Uncharacterized protein n=1 Tax=Sporothrix schenckii 1099-18 TaxID=1397361 RepID=A0A0F2M889_SPOSC|nr:uncharacterized protein SPSK_10069 [Sporothrix schenckii 1099-18]KJR85857.1 hypothetical protein SPSK_10069 [Sporothrix schenckii 1099-18]